MGQPLQGTHARLLKSIASSGLQAPFQIVVVPPKPLILICSRGKYGWPTISPRNSACAPGSPFKPPPSTRHTRTDLLASSRAIVSPAAPAPTMQTSTLTGGLSLRAPKSSSKSSQGQNVEVGAPAAALSLHQRPRVHKRTPVCRSRRNTRRPGTTMDVMRDLSLRRHDTRPSAVNGYNGYHGGYLHSATKAIRGAISGLLRP